ncbi:MAG: SDR family oxidoreductase [Rhizobiaceae bacterium]|nr:SDR family oxidoreductase [Rhizobiaceae bacterium]
MKYWRRKEASGLPILVTGGAGFLGTHLCRRLLRDGHSVVCLDNLLTGTKGNIAGLLHHPNFRFLEADVRDPLYLNVERIFNLACPASPPAYQADPVGTTMTSVLGAYNMLRLAISNGVRIMQASTSEAYGDPLEHPQKETYWGHVNPIGPRACYDVGKRCAESLFFDHRRTFDADIRVARILNTYGGGMRPDDGRVISNFIVEALQDKDITIYGDGQQTRSFCYVDDLIDGFMRLMYSDTDDPGPYNLGNPEEFSIQALAEIVIKLTGSKSKIIYLEKPVDDPRCRRPDIDKAREKLGWKPTTTLKQGLTRTIAHFDSLLSAERTIACQGQKVRYGADAELEV